MTFEHSVNKMLPFCSVALNSVCSTAIDSILQISWFAGTEEHIECCSTKRTLIISISMHDIQYTLHTRFECDLPISNVSNASDAYARDIIPVHNHCENPTYHTLHFQTSLYIDTNEQKPAWPWSLCSFLRSSHSALYNPFKRWSFQNGWSLLRSLLLFIELNLWRMVSNRNWCDPIWVINK